MLKKMYKCDICSDEITDTTKAYGINFSSLNKFKIDSVKSTEGKHICFRCARLLAFELTRTDIDDELLRYGLEYDKAGKN